METLTPALSLRERAGKKQRPHRDPFLRAERGKDDAPAVIMSRCCGNHAREPWLFEDLQNGSLLDLGRRCAQNGSHCPGRPALLADDLSQV